MAGFLRTREGTLLYRLLLATIVSGLWLYWTTAIVAALIAERLSMPRYDAALLPTMLSFPIAVVMVMWLVGSTRWRRNVLLMSVLCVIVGLFSHWLA